MQLAVPCVMNRIAVHMCCSLMTDIPHVSCMTHISTVDSRTSSRTWKKQGRLVDSRDSVQDIQFAPRHLGLKLATCSADGRIRIYEGEHMIWKDECGGSACHHLILCDPGMWRDGSAAPAACDRMCMSMCIFIVSRVSHRYHESVGMASRGRV